MSSLNDQPSLCVMGMQHPRGGGLSNGPTREPQPTGNRPKMITHNSNDAHLLKTILILQHFNLKWTRWVWGDYYFLHAGFAGRHFLQATPAANVVFLFGSSGKWGLAPRTTQTGAPHPSLLSFWLYYEPWLQLHRFVDIWWVVLKTTYFVLAQYFFFSPCVCVHFPSLWDGILATLGTFVFNDLLSDHFGNFGHFFGHFGS